MEPLQQSRHEDLEESQHKSSKGFGVICFDTWTLKSQEE